MRRSSFLLFAFLAGGCTEPVHLQYDYGRAYTEAFTKQADLTRASVQDADFPLYGIEGVKIRVLAQEATTTAKSAAVSSE